MRKDPPPDTRPDPPAELLAWEAAAEKRMQQRPYPPNIKMEPAGMGREDMTSPHSDPALWALQLADAFGTRSEAVINLFLDQLHSLCDRGIWDDDTKQWRIDEAEFSAMLALVNAFRPKDEPEAMLAAQMVATHLLTMKVGARAIRYEYDTRTAATYAKLAKAYAAQIDAMQGLKGKRRTARQSIKVSRESHHHQHIHVHRGAEENDGQCHATTPASRRAALPCPDEGGNVVPLACRPGPEALPPTRRKGGRS